MQSMYFVSALTLRKTSLLTHQTILWAENLVPASLCILSNPLTLPENALFPVGYIHLNTSEEYIFFFL